MIKDTEQEQASKFGPQQTMKVELIVKEE